MENLNRAAQIRKWKARKLPAFLIESSNGETIVFDKDEANELFEELYSQGHSVKVWTAEYDINDPSYIAPNGWGLNNYLKHKLIRYIQEIPNKSNE